MRRIPVNSLQANTIMPDGRPIFAWENEIEMARSEKNLYEIKLKQLQDWMIAHSILELRSWDEPGKEEYKILITINKSTVRLSPRHKLEKNIIKNAKIEIIKK